MTDAEMIKEMMEVWDALTAAAREFYPDASEEDIYRAAASAMSASLNLPAPVFDIQDPAWGCCPVCGELVADDDPFCVKCEQYVEPAKPVEQSATDYAAILKAGNDAMLAVARGVQ